MPENVVHLFGGREAASRRLNPEKLKKARRAKALTQTELARSIGLTRQAISAYEQGTKFPEIDTLAAISRELSQPMAYFIAPEPEVFGPLTARTYRAFGPTTNKRNDQCDVLTQWIAATATYMDRLVNFPEPSIPRVPSPREGDGYSEDEIESSAEAVRSEWGLGVGPIGGLTKLIESRGVFVGRVPVTAGRVNAFSFWSGGRPFIVTGDEATTAVRRRFDMAHELGHLVLHQGIGEEDLGDKPTLDRIESEANRFAGALLLPRSSYPNEVYSTRLSSFVDLKKRWKVAVSAQVYRCADLGIFSEQQILNLRKQISYNKWRTKEPLDDDIVIEGPRMLERATRLAFKGGVLSPSKILSELNLNPEIIGAALGLPLSELQTPADGADKPLTLR